MSATLLQLDNRAIAIQINQALAKGLTTLVYTLDELLDQSRCQDVLSVAIYELGQSQQFKQLMKLLITNETALQEMQKASYYHLNGFDKLVLLSGKNFKLRLHHFYGAKDTKKAAAEHVHDHRWNFASAILYGDMGMNMYNDSTKGNEDYLAYTYTPVVGNSYKAELEGICQISLDQHIRYQKGDSYFMPNDALHSITDMGENGCITLMITGPSTRNTCKLYAKSEIKPSDCTPPRFSKEEVKNKLKALENKLAA